MELKGLVSATVLTLATLLPAAAHATTLPLDDLLFDQDATGILHTKAKLNRDLGAGDYAFAQLHLPEQCGGFFDEWKFTLAGNSDVSINLNDLNIGFGDNLPTPTSTSSHGDHGSSSGNLFDNKFLTFSLFDGSGNLLGSAGEGGTLAASNLLAGQWYTLTVSGKAAGEFGSAYYGNLVVEAVPLSDSLPLFGSALMVLALRSRKKQTH